MNFQIDNGQLMLKAHGQQILIETKLFNGEQTLDFIVQKLEQQENEWIIHWVLPNEVIVIQTYQKNEMQPVLAYQLQLQAQKKLVGIVQQTYGIQNAKMPYYMIPGYLYGTNNLASSKGMQPKFAYRKQENYPATSVLFTRADRSTHNAVLVVTEKSVLGIRIDERSNAKTAYYNGLGIDTRESDVYDRIAITLGYTHLPVWYRGKLKAAAVQPTPTHGYLQLAQGEKLEVSGHLYFDRADSRYDYEKLIENFYYHIHQGPKPWIAQKEGIELLTNALIHDGYNAELHFFPSIVKTDTRLNITGDTAWTGGMQVIYPLAKAIPYNTEAKAVVLDYVDELITKGFNEQTHFFYESKAQNQWQVSGWWAEDLMLFDQNQQKITQAYSAYINGQAVTYILKTIAWLNEIEPSIDTSKWLTVSKEVVDHVIAQQRVDGAFGTYYHVDDGSALSYDSFQGAWFFAASAELAKLTGETKYLQACEHAINFYRLFIENVEVFGMPIDTKDAVDEEGNLAFITGLKTVHEQTKLQAHLELLVHCLHYECSWKFAYNTHFVHEPLKSLQWSSCGGSITSTHNIHIHPMGNLIAEELKYVYELTQNQYFLQRLQDTLLWGLQSFNTEVHNFGFGKAGWMTEQFFHTDAVQDDPTRIEDGGIWPDYLPWGAACILLSLCMESEDVLPPTLANLND